MAKLATVLACVLASSCMLATSQKRTIASRPSGANSGSDCRQMTTKANGSKGPQTTTVNCSSGSSVSNLPPQRSIIGRLLNDKLGRATPRPGTPDLLPRQSITVPSHIAAPSEGW
jgi:hypothetical protein